MTSHLLDFSFYLLTVWYLHWKKWKTVFAAKNLVGSLQVNPSIPHETLIFCCFPTQRHLEIYCPLGRLPSIYFLCWKNEESIDHLFRHCPSWPHFVLSIFPFLSSGIPSGFHVGMGLWAFLKDWSLWKLVSSVAWFAWLQHNRRILRTKCPLELE